MIPPAELNKLERTVRSLMGEGRWMDAISAIRSRAKVYGMSNDRLTKLVAELALELGHVQPLQIIQRQEDALE